MEPSEQVPQSTQQVQPPTQPEVAQSLQKKHLGKWILIVVVLSLFIGFGIFAFFYSRYSQKGHNPYDTTPKKVFTPSPTTIVVASASADINKWITYKNDSLGIVFKYPNNGSFISDAKAINTTAGTGFIDITPNVGYNVLPSEEHYDFRLTVKENKENLSEKDFLVQEAKAKYHDCLQGGTPENLCAGMTEFNPSSLKRYRKGDIEGFLQHIIGGGDVDVNYIRVYESKNSKMYIFEMGGDEGIASPYDLDIFDRILSTFKFTEQKQSGDLGDFPIYPGATFGQKIPHAVGNSKDVNCNIEGLPPSSPCLNDYYGYLSSDPFAKVYHWYMDQERSGWKCSEGAGAVDDPTPSSGSIITTCKKGTLSYFLNMGGDAKAVTLSVGIPVK